MVHYESQVILLNTLLVHLRISTIIPSIFIILKLKGRQDLIDIDQNQKLGANILGTIICILGVIIQNCVDIELQNQSEENTAKDIQIMKVVHDLKNPILSLRNMVGEESACGIELDDMETMLDNLRTKYKYKQGMNFKETPVQVNVADLLKSLMNTHESLARTYHNQLLMESSKSIPSQIIVERSILKRILNNFLSNSLKHTKNGEVTLSINIQNYEQIQNEADLQQKNGKIEQCSFSKGDLFIMWDISDTGVGIKKEKMQSIFDDQVSDQIEANWEGTGLGLPICAQMCAQIGGFIRYKSRQGINPITSFRLYLPLHQGQEGNMDHDFSICNDFRVKNDPSYKHMCNALMLVEDNKGIRKMQQKVLAEADIMCIAFSDGQECWDQLAGFDAQHCSCCKMVIVTDLVMPGMGGDKLASLIRQQIQDVQVIIVLATADEGEGMTYDASLFDEIWSKPVKAQSLKQLYNTHFIEQ